MTEPGEVFISYSWDDEEHIRAVLELSNRLRGDGIDCVLDQYELSPPEGWPRWMDRKISGASHVLVICTEKYLDRIEGREPDGKGLGVKWEGGIIYQHLYNAGANNQKFIPVLRESPDRKFIPMPLQGATAFCIDSLKGYQRLYNRILGIPPAEKPPLGQRKPQPKKDVKTTFATYVLSPIAIDLWDKAKWKATVFGTAANAPPVLGLAFLYRDPAEKIFEGWTKRWGDSDVFEELRISIVEGDIPGEKPGYSVHVGLNVENVARRLKKAGLEISEDSQIITIGRVHRMNPLPTSTFLQEFKAAYKKFGEYILVPATCDSEGSDLKLCWGMQIRKKEILFRRVEDIGTNDEDSVVFRPLP